MSKPIDKLDFWKERIDTAKKDYFTVYVCGEEMWKNINEVHKKILLDTIPHDANVLDAGCGYGRWSELFTPEQYTGVDFSPDFIEMAKSKYPNHTFKVENLKYLSFFDKQFDWAFCVSIKKMVMDNLGEEEWNNMLKELKRVAKNVLILEYEDPNPYEVL